MRSTPQTKSDRDTARPGRSTTSATTTSEVRTTELRDDVLSSLYVDKTFKQPFVKDKSCVTSVCFDDRGDTLVTAGNDEQIQIFSLNSGRHSKTHYSKKYGVDLVRFTHSSGSIIHASTKLDHAVRHHSLHDNKYIRYFQGHQSRVSSLQMSPANETFLSAAVNESVRLYDLRAANAQACMVIEGHPLVAYDPSGTIFALALNERREILLYDVRRWSVKPFITFVIPLKEDDMHIASISFNPSGSLVLIGTSADESYVVDASSGSLILRLCGRSPAPAQRHMDGVAAQEGPQQSPSIDRVGWAGQDMGWTPDGKYVYASTHDNRICFWYVADRSPERRGMAVEPCVFVDLSVSMYIRTVAFNPRSAMMICAGDQIALLLTEQRPHSTNT